MCVCVIPTSFIYVLIRFFSCQLCAKSYIRNLFNQTELPSSGLRKNNGVPESGVKSKANRTMSVDKPDDDINNNMNVVENDEEDDDDDLIIKNINNKDTINLNRKSSVLMIRPFSNSMFQ